MGWHGTVAPLRAPMPSYVLFSTDYVGGEQKIKKKGHHALRCSVCATGLRMRHRLATPGVERLFFFPHDSNVKKCPVLKLNPDATSQYMLNHATANCFFHRRDADQ